MSDDVNAALVAAGTTPLLESTTADKLLKRPQLSVSVVAALCGFVDVDAAAAAAVWARVAADARYGGALERAERDIARERALDDESLPPALFDRLQGKDRLAGISNEVKEKLLRLRPSTLGQASRIQGITPAAIGLLAVEVKKLAATI